MLGQTHLIGLLLVITYAATISCSSLPIVPSISTAANFQKGDNEANAINQETNGRGNTSRSNQQVVSNAKNVNIIQNHGINPWYIVLLFSILCAVQLFIIGLLIERPKKKHLRKTSK